MCHMLISVRVGYKYNIQNQTKQIARHRQTRLAFGNRWDKNIQHNCRLKPSIELESGLEGMFKYMQLKSVKLADGKWTLLF